MSMSIDKKMNNRCAIYGTSGAFGKPGYTESLTEAKAAVDDLAEKGICTFVTEARDGFELEMSIYIQQKKNANPNIRLVIAKPYPNFNTNWRTKPILQSVMDKADMVKYIAEDEEQFSAELLDLWIVSHCDTVLYISRTKNSKINRLSKIDLTDKRIIYVPQRPNEDESLDETSRKEVYPYNLIAAIMNVDSEALDLQAFSEDIEEKIGSALEECLKEREVFVMEERYIEGKRLQEIGDSLGLSRERIRQLISKSIRKLRYYSRRNGLFSDGDVEKKDLGNNVGQKWTPGEEARLVERYNQGYSIEEIAKLHGRGKGGIRSRLRKLGIDPDEKWPSDDTATKGDEEIAPFESDTAEIPSRGLNLNEIVVAAVQVPGQASFDNYDELKAYLESGLEIYNNTVYSLENIEQARRDHFVLKSVRKKLTDTKKAIQTEYSLPIELVVQQLDELINMVNGPYKSLDRMLKANAKEIKRRDIMSYAQSRAAVLGKYADSVIQSPSFFNARWCNASYSDTKWKRDVDNIIIDAKSSIEYILDNSNEDVGIVLGYYFDKLSLSGLDSFLYNVRKEEVRRPTETVFIDINTGEIIERAEEQEVDEIADIEPKQTEVQIQEEEPIGKSVINKHIVLSGTEEQIDRYLATADQFGVSVKITE